MYNSSENPENVNKTHDFWNVSFLTDHDIVKSVIYFSIVTNYLKFRVKSQCSTNNQLRAKSA